MTGLEGIVLRQRLQKRFDAQTLAVRYRSVSLDVASNAREIAACLRTQRADTMHLVAHSLGGLVVLKMFEQGAAAWLPPGRIVLLGSPVQGSRAAISLARLPLGRRIMGRSVRDELLTPRVRRWSGQRELGVIAGTLSLGLGRLVGVGGHEPYGGPYGEPNDGTIYVNETRIEGASDHLLMPVSHSRLPFAESVADQTAAFLATGRFMRPDQVP